MSRFPGALFQMSIICSAILFSTFTTSSALAQNTIRGRVIDAATGDAIIGASVYLQDFNEGSFTDFDGFFQFRTRNQGQTNLIATSIGYEKVTKYISLTGQGLMDMGDIRIKATTIGLEQANVIASVAIDRATPIAVSTIDAPQTQFGIQARMDLPKNFRAGASYVYNTRLFAQFEIDQDRDDEERIGIQPIELPSYGYLDCNLNWFTRKDGLDISLGLNIQNALNEIYMNEADETWITNPTTGIKEQGTIENGRLQGYWSYGRTISFSVKVGF